VSDKIKDYLATGEDKFNNGPSIIQMSFDRSCNYKCPSCRVDMIVANSEKIKTVNLTIDEIEDAYSNSIETIYCSGTADPFASVSYRNFLKNFNPKKYPKLKSIHLHTNASLWDKEMWDSMPNIHKYVSSCEISIDAATQNTYENVTRLGGNWDNLLKNLRFISTIKSIKTVKCSFVVQQSNYIEMSDFFNIIYSIFGEKTKVFYGRLTNWGTFSDERFKFLDVADKNHPEHSFFLVEFNKIAVNPFVFHNLHNFIEKQENKLI
jgi:MoaA/NifB/PqqE/SkfB family radical SAM enzyme